MTIEASSLTATGAAEAIRTGTLTSEALVRACLNRIAEREPVVQAWALVAEALATAAAVACDGAVQQGLLHGVPVGIKDVIDTADMATSYGSPAFAGHQPQADAAVVTLLRNAGAVIIGKTVTAEFATYHPGPTTNPLDPLRTPGGSSSGSAAAVADNHVPIAIGTQTVGSTLRPASFCGIHGFKPTIARYPTGGSLTTSPTLDTIGIFARSLDDLLLLDTVLAPAPPPAPLSTGKAILIARTAAWDQASAAMQEALRGCAAALGRAGFDVIETALPSEIDQLIAAQSVIHRREVWQSLGTIRDQHHDEVSREFAALVDSGAAITSAEYAAAVADRNAARAILPSLFDGVQVILTPAAPGIAPLGLGATGDPVFSRIWTALGTPCLGFPWGEEKAMPLGLQLIGQLNGDRALIEFAKRALAMIAPASS